MERLDKWIIKKLNKAGNLPPQTDKAYWYTFRGLKNLHTENTAAYIGHAVERILNDAHETLDNLHQHGAPWHLASHQAAGDPAYHSLCSRGPHSPTASHASQLASS